MKTVLPLIAALAILLLPVGLTAQATVSADTGDGLTAYQTFSAAGFGVEGPDDSSGDCASGNANDAGNHKAFGEHVLEISDAALGQDVFAFVSHINEDSDRCINYDRVRMEIKGGPAGQSVPELEHAEGTESHYRWQFKLPADFQGSSSFCHLFQNKAQGGSETGFPVLTLTARTSVMELIHAPEDSGSSAVDLDIVPLSPFLGNWVEVYIRQVHANNGELEVVIQDVATGATLMNYTNTNIDLFRTGATINRPKWGIYRKIVSGLKDETLLFANFCSSENGDVCPTLVDGTGEPQPFSYSTPLTVSSSRNKRVLTWGVSNQSGSDYFDVERSDDGINFASLAQLQADGDLSPEKIYTYNDATSISGTVIYRIKLTDLDGTTHFSNEVSITASGGGGGGGGNGGGKPKKQLLFPNPTTAELTVTYPTDDLLNFRVLTLTGREIVHGQLFPGRRTLDVRTLPPGTYVIQLHDQAGERTTRKFVKL